MVVAERRTTHAKGNLALASCQHVGTETSELVTEAQQNHERSNTIERCYVDSA